MDLRPGFRLLLVAATLLATTAACGRPVPSATLEALPAPPATETSPPSDASPLVMPTFSPGEIAGWIMFRQRYGLRHDVEWLIQVANDPRSANEMSVPLLPDEIDVVGRRNLSVQDTVSAVQGYGEMFPDEFAGVYIEDLTTIIIEFTDRHAAHEADLDTLFGEGAPIEVRMSPYSIRELRSLADEVEAEAGWFPEVGAELYSAGIGEISNAVLVRYKADDESVEPVIHAHFGSPDWMEFERQGPLPWAGPRGALRVHVVDEAGKGIDVSCSLIPLDTRVRDSRLPFDAPDGVCAADDLEATAWELRVAYLLNDEEVEVSTQVRVPEGGIGEGVVVIDP